MVGAHPDLSSLPSCLNIPGKFFVVIMFAGFLVLFLKEVTNTRQEYDSLCVDRKRGKFLGILFEFRALW